MSVVIDEAQADLAATERKILALTLRWRREKLAEQVPDWPPDGMMSLLRHRNECRERLMEAGGPDPDDDLQD